MTSIVEDFNNKSITCSVATFCIAEEQVAQDHRKLPEKHLSILLVKEDKWSLLKGSVDNNISMSGNVLNTLSFSTLNEITDKCVEQTLDVATTESGVELGYMVKCSEKFLVKELENKTACWFIVKYTDKGTEVLEDETTRLLKKRVGVQLSSKDCEEELYFVVTVNETTNLETGNTRVDLVLTESNCLSEQECVLIVRALQRLHSEAKNDIEGLFTFLPKYFTFKEFQSIYELLIGKESDPSAFRRKVGNFVAETEQREYSGSRKAKLYVRKLN